MKKIILILALATLSCEKHENYKQCQETVNGKPYFVKKESVLN